MTLSNSSSVIRSGPGFKPGQLFRAETGAVLTYDDTAEIAVAGHRHYKADVDVLPGIAPGAHGFVEPAVHFLEKIPGFRAPPCRASPPRRPT